MTITTASRYFPSNQDDQAGEAWERDYSRQWLRDQLAAGRDLNDLRDDAAALLATDLAEYGEVDLGWLYAFRLATRLAHFRTAQLLREIRCPNTAHADYLRKHGACPTCGTVQA